MDTAYTPAGYCTRCGYPTDIGVCSECGNHNERVHSLSPRARRRRRYRRVLLLLVLAALVSGVWYGGRYAIYQYWPVSHLESIADGGGRWSDTAFEIIRARRDRWWAVEAPKGVKRQVRIDAEIQRLAEHEWAGVYSNMLSRIAVAPDSGYYTWKYPLLGPWTMSMYGDVVRATEDRIILKPSADPALYSYSMDTEFIRVRWGDRQGIVRAADMISFCNSVNSGRSYAPFGFLRRRSVPKVKWKRPSTPPRVPADYQKYLLREPIEGEIVRVGQPVQVPGSRWRNGNYLVRVPATINVGSRDGIQVGMSLYHIHNRRHIQWAYVKSVQSESCGVAIRYQLYPNEDYDKRDDALKVGWKFSTRQTPGK